MYDSLAFFLCTKRYVYWLVALFYVTLAKLRDNSVNYTKLVLCYSCFRL